VETSQLINLLREYWGHGCRKSPLSKLLGDGRGIPQSHISIKRNTGSACASPLKGVGWGEPLFNYGNVVSEQVSGWIYAG